MTNEKLPATPDEPGGDKPDNHSNTPSPPSMKRHVDQDEGQTPEELDQFNIENVKENLILPGARKIDIEDGSYRENLTVEKQTISGAVENIQADEAYLAGKASKLESAGELPELGWNLTRRRNPNFTGRLDLLNILSKTLKTSQPVAISQTISGLGGVGKTQTAVEYAYRHAVDRKDYSLVWWIEAENDSLAFGLAQLADKLELPERFEKDLKVKVEAVKKWLSQSKNWLLIFDNAEDPAMLEKYLPEAGQGHIIITSRDPNWRSIATTLKLEVFKRPESLEFLDKRTGLDHKAEKRAGELANSLGDLPLALEQAGAFIEVHGISYAKYLELFNKRRQELWQEEQQHKSQRREGKEYPDTVATTWSLSIEQVKQESPASLELLNMCAFLAPDDIPQWLFTKDTEHLSKNLQIAAADELRFITLVGTLRKYSIIDTRPDFISVHRLVQAVTRDGLTGTNYLESALGILEDSLQYEGDDLSTWEQTAQIVSHIQAATEYAIVSQIDLYGVGWLLNEIGMYLHDQSEHTAAEKALNKAVLITEQLHGKDHTSVAASRSNLGLVLQDLGKLREAREMLETAFTIDVKAYGLSHPNVAIRVNNLGSILKDLGELEAARQMYEKALKIDASAYEPGHPSIARDLNNIASVLRDQGELSKAKEMFEKALKAFELTYGTDHHNVATLANNLGLVLKDLGNWEEARQMYERALKIFEASYGTDHPNVTATLNNLANVLKELAEWEEARQLYQRALKIDATTYGPEHPEVAIVMNNLGSTLQHLGEHREAKLAYERALKIAEAAYGPDHLQVSIYASNLGSILQELGEQKEARRMFIRALKIFKDHLSPDHAHIAYVTKALNSLPPE